MIYFEPYLELKTTLKQQRLIQDLYVITKIVRVSMLHFTQNFVLTVVSHLLRKRL